MATAYEEGRAAALHEQSMSMCPYGPDTMDRSFWLAGFDNGRKDREAAERRRAKLDPRTGRPLGDHGTAVQAINFALDWQFCQQPDVFLRGWREGSLDEWPEFYDWLRAQEAKK